MTASDRIQISISGLRADQLRKVQKRLENQEGVGLTPTMVVQRAVEILDWYSQAYPNRFLVEQTLMVVRNVLKDADFIYEVKPDGSCRISDGKGRTGWLRYVPEATSFMYGWSSLGDDTCPICSSKAAPISSAPFDGSHLWCEQCGEFKLSRSAFMVLGRYRSPKERAKISSWVFHENRENRVPTVTTNELSAAVAKSLPSLRDRTEMLLAEMLRGLKSPADRVHVLEPRFFAATYTPRHSAEELRYLAELLAKQGMLVSGDPPVYQVSLRGHGMESAASEVDRRTQA